MTLIGIISDCKTFSNIKDYLNNEDITLIHINRKSIENLKNIKFETIVINSDLEKLENQKGNISKLCNSAKNVVINTDFNIDESIVRNCEKRNCITYGLNRDATVTISSITDSQILIYLQRNIKEIEKGLTEIGEKSVEITENNKLKNYEILVIYILNLIHKSCIIEQI